MVIVKLDATDSTNGYLKALSLAENLDDFTVVVAKAQLKGRGQMGASWQAEPGKNLTFSILKKFDSFNVINQFQLNICVSLAIYEALKNLSVPDLTIKWPNDIMSGNSKICGILIENLLSGNQIATSVIGIGLNVNQLAFNTLTNVSSLKLLLGQTLNLDELLHRLLENQKTWLSKLGHTSFETLQNAYEERLFRKDKPSTFRAANGVIFMGFIRKISAEGKLVIAHEDDVMKSYGLKEIQLLY